MHLFSRFPRGRRAAAALLVPWLSFFVIDVFVFAFTGAAGRYSLACSAVWAAIFSGALLLLPHRAARLLFALLYELSAVYAVIQAGYFQIFGKLMWITDLLYLRDGAEFAGSVFSYLPPAFVPTAAALLLWGFAAQRLYPAVRTTRPRVLAVCCGALTAVALLPFLLNAACADDSKSLGLGTDFYAGKSLRRAYDLMYDAEKVYALCGLYQTAGRDIWVHLIQPQLPGSRSEETRKLAQIEAYFDVREPASDNDMTGMFAGKNVILVLMESADDWTLSEQTTPTICRLMREGIDFTNLYTPLYGSVRTFNTEFTVNTGIFSPTNGNLTFTYCDNTYAESLPSQFRRIGYTAKAFHYNVPTFYSRGIMEPAMGYEQYISYVDYVPNQNQFSSDLFEDSFVLTNPELNAQLLDDTPFFHFIISRNAHMPYGKNDSVGKYALEKYPAFTSVSEHEEIPHYLAKMRLLDDFFSNLLDELERKNLLENTVIVGFTDHYSYSMEDQDKVRELSNVPVDLMVEKTPFFIWSADGPAVTVNKTLSTADIAPTLVNLFGLDTGCNYLGRDAFDPTYDGCAVFSDGSWIDGNVVWQDGAVVHEFFDGAAQQTDLTKRNEEAQAFIQTSNLILETDYYARQ